MQCHRCFQYPITRSCTSQQLHNSLSWTLYVGNAGHTLITRSFARQLGLVDMDGNPTQAYSRTIRVQGVVAGAFEMIKTLNITYEIKGASLLCTRDYTLARVLGCIVQLNRLCFIGCCH